MIDRSNGYENIAAEFVSTRSTTIGVRSATGPKRCHAGPLLLILAVGPAFPLLRFWWPKVLESMALMPHHLSSKHSDAISQTHPLLAKRSKIPIFLIELSMVSWHGDSCFCFRPRISGA